MNGFPRQAPLQLPTALPAVILVVVGAGAGGVLAAQDPRSLFLVMGVIGAIGALAAAYWTPGLVFAAFLAIPFYKAGLQPYVPVDITIILSILNLLQLPLLFQPFAPHGSRFVLKRFHARAVMLWLGFTLTIVIGVSYAPDVNVASTVAMTWFVLTFLPCLAAIRVASDPRFLKQLVTGLFLIGLAVVVAGMYLLPQVGEWPNDRLRVFGSHTIRVGQAALLVPLVGVLSLLRSPNALVKLIALGSVPPALLVAASSGSRGPLLMLFVCCAIFSARRFWIWVTGQQGQRPRVAPLRLFIPVLLGSVLLVVVPSTSLIGLVPETSAERLESLATILNGIANDDLQQDAPDNSTGDRLLAYEYAELMFQQSPLIGHGTSSFATTIESGKPQLNWTVETAHPHNMFLQVGAEQGLMGLTVLVLLIGAAIRRGVRASADPTWNTVLVVFVFFLLSAMVSTDAYENRTLWGLLVLLLMAPESGPQHVSQAIRNRTRGLPFVPCHGRPLPQS